MQSLHCSNHFNLDTVYLYIISSTHYIQYPIIVLIISILTLFISISSLVHTHYIQYPINVLIISILTALFISISYLVQTHYRQYAIIVLIITILTLFISISSLVHTHYRQYAIIGRQYMYVCTQNLVYLYDEY